MASIQIVTIVPCRYRCVFWARLVMISLGGQTHPLVYLNKTFLWSDIPLICYASTSFVRSEKHTNIPKRQRISHAPTAPQTGRKVPINRRSPSTSRVKGANIWTLVSSKYCSQSKTNISWILSQKQSRLVVMENGGSLCLLVRVQWATKMLTIRSELYAIFVQWIVIYAIGLYIVLHKRWLLELLLGIPLDMSTTLRVPS